MKNVEIAREVASRIKLGSPYTVTNRERMRIWIEEVYWMGRKDEQYAWRKSLKREEL